MKPDESLLPFWDDSMPAIPQRSPLLPIEPLGLGTAGIESLTSYIHRLADALSLPTQALVTLELSCRLQRKSMLSTKDGHCDLYSALGAALNGNTGSAAEMVELLHRLNQRSDLNKLTMLRCGLHIATTPLVRTRQAWCPMCYRHWHEGKQPLYNPLLWTLETVRLCHLHHIPLMEKCGKCGAAHRPLCRRQIIGHCPRCGAWLGADGAQNSSESPIDARNWDLAVVEEVGEFLVKLQGGPERTEGRFAENVRRLVASCFNSRHAFSLFIGMHPKTVKSWTEGTQTPSLESAAFLSCAFKIPIWDLLFSDIRLLELKPRRSPRDDASGAARPALRHHDLENIRTELQSVLENNPFPPPSFRSLCTRLNCDQSYLKRVMPEIAGEISRRFKVFLSTKRKQRIHFTKMLVRSSVNELYCRGEYPSYRKMAEHLPVRISLRERFAREERLSAMHELGIINDEYHQRNTDGEQ